MPKKGKALSSTNKYRTKKSTTVRSPGWKSQAGARRAAANSTSRRRGRSA